MYLPNDLVGSLSVLPPTGKGPAEDPRMLEEYETSCPYAFCVAVKSSTVARNLDDPGHHIP